MLKILFIGLVWPEPNSSAAGWRILHLIKLFAKQYEVHFASAAAKSDFSFDLTSIGVQEHPILLNDSSFDDFIKTLSPDVVFFDRFMVEEQYGWRVAEYCPQTLRILDTEDLHFLRLARQESYKKNAPIDLKSSTTKREIAAVLRSDLSLIISQTEMNLLQQEFDIKEEQLFYIPFQEDNIDATQVLRKDFEDRKDFVFIGNFIHEPNWKTVEVLKREVWPILRKKLPEAALHIYGAYASEKVIQLNNPKERFYIKGRAEDARKTLENYRVLVAPIPFGAGTKGKFVDAMYAGTPCMSSTVGAEDMMLEDKWNGFVEDDLEKFVNQSVELYNNEQVWRVAQQQGYEIFNHSYADNSFSQNLLTWLDKNIGHADVLRDNNFIGQILLQQQVNALKYMSLWIEAKNKKTEG